MKKRLFEWILKRAMKMYGYEDLTYTVHDSNTNVKDNCIAITFSMIDSNT